MEAPEAPLRLAGPFRPDPSLRDVPGLVRDAAARLGQRPAVTVRTADVRSEQGAASLAGWAAKGAHLLADDPALALDGLGLAPGSSLALDAPPSWTTAAVCLAAWWAGLVVVPAGDAPVAVVHARRPHPPGAHTVLTLGDAFDGSDPAGDPDASFVVRAQPLPDRPPAPSGAPERTALAAAGRTWTQAELVALARDLASVPGPIGVVADPAAPPPADPEDWARLLAAVALRPLATGAATVVALGVDAAALATEGVTSVLGGGDPDPSPDRSPART